MAMLTLFTFAADFTYFGPDNDMDISQMDPNVATTTCSLRPPIMPP